MDFLWSPWRGDYVTSSKRPEGCVFCHLAKGSDENRVSFDSEHFVLFRGTHNFVVLNLFPYTTAHLMVIPYHHSGDFASSDKATSTEMMDLAKIAQQAIADEYRPNGFNLGMNLGSAAGAGVADHYHLHLLPRWNGDANFMTTVGETRVLPESLEKTYTRLKPRFIR